jgi:hypothetical protein
MTGLLLGLLAAGAGQSLAAATPEWLNAYEVKVRAAGQPDFKAAGRIGVEFFRDPPAAAVVAVSEKGQIAVVPAGEANPDKKAGWLFAHDLKARGPDEEAFSAATRAFGVEGYKDQHTGKLLYLSHVGGLTLTDYPATVLTGKGAAFHHAVVLKVRGPSEDGFTAASKRVNVEAYREENTGGLVYLTDGGGVAAAAVPADTAAVKLAPLYGQAVRVRSADETGYTDATKRLGLEVYRDATTGHLLYVTEAGGLAVVPAPAGGVTKGKGFREERGLLLVARPAGEDRLAAGKRVSVEVLTDNNTGYTVYVADTGSVAVLPKK